MFNYFQIWSRAILQNALLPAFLPHCRHDSRFTDRLSASGDGDTLINCYDTALRTGTNRLRLEVVNLWPNRLIGDAELPANKRITKTNITRFTGSEPLSPSRLLGPVRLLAAQPPATTIETDAQK